jgi:hypothetical protein
MIDISQKIQASTPAIKPTQIIADLDTIYKMASDADPELRALIARIAEDTNGQTQFPNGLKGMERALQKINADYKGDASRITDITRGRIVYETLDDLYSGLKTLHEEGVIAYFKDRFLKPADSGYSDILTNVELSNTHIGELRLELRQINEVASVEHLIYEQIRSIKAEVLIEGRDLTPQETMIMDNLQIQAQKLYHDAWQKLIQNIKH